MQKYFLYIDESKRFQEGVLILWGFLSQHNKSYSNHAIEAYISSIWLSDIGELKSTSKYGEYFVAQDGIQTMYDVWVIDTIVGTYREWYYRDSYEWYRDALIELIGSLGFMEDLSIVYIDYLPLVSSRSELQKSLKRDISAHFPYVRNIIPESSERQRSIQLADLITGKIKEYYLFRENIELFSIFGMVKHSIKTKKNPLAVTSSSVLSGTGSIT